MQLWVVTAVHCLIESSEAGALQDRRLQCVVLHGCCQQNAATATLLRQNAATTLSVVTVLQYNTCLRRNTLIAQVAFRHAILDEPTKRLCC